MYNTDDFITQVDLSGVARDGRYEDSEILNMAYYQFTSVLVPLILSLREEFYVASESQSITQSQSAYPIPYRALGLTLREVKLVKGTEIVDLDRIDPTKIFSTAEGTPNSFYTEGQDIVLYPTPNTTANTLKLSYFLTPNIPVVLTETALITAIDRVTGVITAEAPTEWTSAGLYDFISSKNGHKTLAADQTSSNVSITSLTFASIPPTLVVGDYIALAGQSPYFQCPDVCFKYLVQLTISDLLMSIGAVQELQASQAKEMQLQSIIQSTLSNRVLGAPKRFTIQGY